MKQALDTSYGYKISPVPAHREFALITDAYKGGQLGADGIIGIEDGNGGRQGAFEPSCIRS